MNKGGIAKDQAQIKFQEVQEAYEVGTLHDDFVEIGTGTSTKVSRLSIILVIYPVYFRF